MRATARAPRETTVIELDKHGDVFVLRLGDGDNRFNDVSIAGLHAALDEVEAAAAPAALVTTATGKIWSNGLDLDHMAKVDDAIAFVHDVEGIFARFLRLPVPTVAAIQGHAFAAGAMLALAHDVRVMRVDRGYLCLPEIDLGMTFTDGFAELIRAKLPQPALHRMMVLGERLDAPTAVQVGAVDAVAELDAVLDTAIGRARDLAGKAGPTVRGIRRNLYGPVLSALDG
jgi:enoyl-CoA hydratase/carnithine racemase